MKQTRLIMGMPVTVEVVDMYVSQKDIYSVFAYFMYVDDTFSMYKSTSETSMINQGKIKQNNFSKDMQDVLSICEQTKKQTGGYFDMHHKGEIDPTGVVKGWAIWMAAKLLEKRGFKNYYVDAGGDVQVSGVNSTGAYWSVGIQNPFQQKEIVKVLHLHNKGISTSGTAMRGQHIYNPHRSETAVTDIVSITVIGSNVCDADRFATAAFAMGKKGIAFIEQLPEFEGYMISASGIATYTTGFKKYELLQ